MDGWCRIEFTNQAGVFTGHAIEGSYLIGAFLDLGQHDSESRPLRLSRANTDLVWGDLRRQSYFHVTDCAIRFSVKK